MDDLLFVVAASIAELMTSRDAVIRHSISSTPLLPDEAAGDEGNAAIVSNVVSSSSVYVMYSPFLPCMHFVFQNTGSEEKLFSFGLSSFLHRFCCFSLSVRAFPHSRR